MRRPWLDAEVAVVRQSARQQYRMQHHQYGNRNSGESGWTGRVELPGWEMSGVGRGQGGWHMGDVIDVQTIKQLVKRTSRQ